METENIRVLEGIADLISHLSHSEALFQDLTTNLAKSHAYLRTLQDSTIQELKLRINAIHFILEAVVLVTENPKLSKRKLILRKFLNGILGILKSSYLILYLNPQDIRNALRIVVNTLSISKSANIEFCRSNTLSLIMEIACSGIE